MANITHKISVATAPDITLRALNEVAGLANWWTRETTGDTTEGGTLQFRFNGEGSDFRVIRSTSSNIQWECIAGPEEWINTQVLFDLAKDGAGTAIYFQHRMWAEESPFHYHCSMKWAAFLLSLKAYLDTGEGRAFPNDIAT